MAIATMSRGSRGGVRFFQRLLTAAAAAGLTLVFFMVLPLIQAISSGPKADTVLAQVDTAELPPPPPPPEEEEPEEQEEEPPPPELTEEAPPLDLSQLELALNPGMSDGFMGGDFGVKLNALGAGSEENEALFSLGDLDTQPRAVHRAQPVITAKMRKKAPGTVTVIFIVDERGRVVNPKIQSSSDPVFTKPTLDAIKKWKFEPGKRGGKAVKSRMRIPISYPK